MCLPMDVKNVYLAAESLYWATESITPAENNFLPRKKFFPPEGVLFSSRGKFCPPGTRQSHIVSIFRPCADEPFGEEPSMIVNSETPHRGMSVHMTDDNTEKIGKFPCSIGGKSVTLHANSGFMRDI